MSTFDPHKNIAPVPWFLIFPEAPSYGANPANVQQTSSKCIQNTRANAGRLLDHVNTLDS